MGATTNADVGNSYGLLISIHAPAKGATPHVVNIRGEFLDISIHAPAKGATY